MTPPNSPRPPTSYQQHSHTIPQFNIQPLTQTNFIQWCHTVDSYAILHNISAYIHGPIPPKPAEHAAQDLHQRNTALARLLILPNISQDIVKTLSPTILNSPTHTLYAYLKEKMSTIPPQHSEANLRRQADQLKHVHGEPIQEYIDRHNSLRNTMLQSAYPHIDDEQTTVQFVINGLYHLPDWAPLLRNLANFHNFHQGQRPSLSLVYSMLIEHEKATPQSEAKPMRRRVRRIAQSVAFRRRYG